MLKAENIAVGVTWQLLRLADMVAVKWPYSDIDIMILMPKTPSAAHTKFIEFMLYILWDQCQRLVIPPVVSESIAAARDNQTVLTSLLEMRRVAGMSHFGPSGLCCAARNW